jgi:glycosyltransferase involved in cell wall biosynthesis
MYYAMFNESYPPQTDGVAQTTRNYAVWLNRKHGDCCVVAPQHALAAGHESDEEFPVIRFASMPLFLVKEYSLGLPQIAFRTSTRLEGLPIDLVHAHCPFASGTLAMKTALKKDVPLVATFHSKFADDFAQRLKMENAGKIAARYTAKFFGEADEAWAVNNSTAQTLREYGYRGPITVMPNGCDFEPLARTPANRKAVQKQFGLADRPLLLFVGRVVEQKNIPFLLQALRILKESHDFNLLAIGDGEGIMPYRKLAAEMGIGDRIFFPGAIREREPLRSIYAAADVFVLPSVYDNAPLVVREAAACGCPSALIANTNAAEGITDGLDGFTSELNPAAYAAMLEKLLANPGLIRAAGENARQTVYISWERIVDRVAVEYERIISEYKDKKAAARGRRRRYSIPVALAREILNKQVVRIRFTTKNLDRLAHKHTEALRAVNQKRLEVIRARLIGSTRRQDR